MCSADILICHYFSCFCVLD